ncbi:glycosyl hydrolase family 28-related protein [Conexibacter woesei]|uniref:Endopygalactorunase-like protein n=1 Tax=Conexibacter woesei (strain DSM 14684 / CCUG 47730 / CIP 108061 / JCM 11494 / NBRC 100937 / ID131577) TaxID=469383 RepID=D3F368_CONWI|nr:glycosyl hydrolase family 28-related protein [Conexibacter woesei]ADB50348.1 Endopygalactorunase-like protein [Conexibacter woesei DSM 14684]
MHRLRPSARAALLCCAALAALPALAAARTYDVTAPPYSAAGNGTTNDRLAIQQAIEDASAAGGGTVLVPAGRTFLSGGIRLRSNVTFQLDGTLQQSLNTAHYAVAPMVGWDVPGSTLNWDSTAFHNQPFVFAADAENVTLTTSGRGTIQMGVTPTSATAIRVDAIGFRDVERCWINNITTRDVIGFNIVLDRANHCDITGTYLNSKAGSLGSDGINITGSQHVKVLYNHVSAGDDGLYIAVSYGDPRFTGPWRAPDTGGAARYIEIANNEVVDFGHQNAFTLIPWGSLDPDQRNVEISDVSIHDNTFIADVAQAVDCRCDNPWRGTRRYFQDTDRGDQSPMTRFSMWNNVFISRTRVPNFPTWVGATFTDSQFGGLSGAPGAIRSSPSIQNGGFERTGSAWWSIGGVGGATNDPAMLPAGAGAALRALGGWAGFVLPSGTATTSLVQGLGLENAADLGLPLVGVAGAATYRLDATVVTNGQPFRVYAHDTCENRVLAQQTVSATTATRVSLPFSVTRSCGNVHLGIDRGGATSGWALIDDVELRAPVVGNEDPSLRTVGTWGRDWAGGDMGGTHHHDNGTGSTVTIPFTGTRGRVLAPKGPGWGIASVSVDGGPAVDVDLYGAAAAWHATVFDTGVLPFGRHTVTMTVSGRKHPSSTGTWIAFDALLVS